MKEEEKKKKKKKKYIFSNNMHRMQLNYLQLKHKPAIKFHSIHKM
jgi:hypothetical protein